MLHQHSWKKLTRARHHELKPSQGNMVLVAGIEQGRGRTHEGLRGVHPVEDQTQGMQMADVW